GRLSSAWPALNMASCSHQTLFLKGQTMASKRMLLVLLLVVGICFSILTSPSTGQIRAGSRTNARLDEIQTTVLQQLVRQHALTIKPHDLATLPSLGKPLAPFPTRPAKPLAKPLAIPSSRPKSKESHSNAHLLAASTGKTAKAALKPTAKDHTADASAPPKNTPSFNPYPKGPEPSLPPPLPAGYYPAVQVLAPGRLDW